MKYDPVEKLVVRKGTRTALCILALYMVMVLLVFVVFGGITIRKQTKETPNLYGSLDAKTKYYKEHENEYDLVFIGDSRTYCGIHPDMIDSKIGTHSINLASFAHWFPTQFPQIQDVVDSIPSNTVVVWSIGHQNFAVSGDDLWAQNSPYCIGLKNVLLYLMSGFKPVSVIYNLYKCSCVYKIIEELRKDSRVFKERMGGIIYQRHVERVLNVKAKSSLRSCSSSNDIVVQPKRYSLDGFSDFTVVEIVAWLQKDTNVSYVSVFKDQNVDTSIVVTRKGGTYYRIELEPEYFRKKQKEMVAWRTVVPTNYDLKIERPYWLLFEKSLDLMRKKNIHLIVNELEEAPYIYGNSKARNSAIEQMRLNVEPIVHQKGFEYIRVDLGKLNDDDYFDRNHLNSKGIAKYTDMLCEKLKPLVGKATEVDK